MTIGVVYRRKRYEQNPYITKIFDLIIGTKTTEKGKIVVQLFFLILNHLIRRTPNILCCLFVRLVTTIASESNGIKLLPPWKIHTCLLSVIVIRLASHKRRCQWSPPNRPLVLSTITEVGNTQHVPSTNNKILLRVII